MRELNRDEINKVSGGWDFSSGITTSTPSNFSLGSGSYSHDYNGYSGTSNHSYSWGGANKARLSQWASCLNGKSINETSTVNAAVDVASSGSALEAGVKVFANTFKYGYSVNSCENSLGFGRRSLGNIGRSSWGK